MTMYVTRVEVATVRREGLSAAQFDMAGGRMATHGAAISIAPSGAEFDVLLYGEYDNPGEALNESIKTVRLAFTSVGVDLTYQAGTVYTEDVFDEREARSAHA